MIQGLAKAKQQKYIYIYICREREMYREREIDTRVYIYIYIERERCACVDNVHVRSAFKCHVCFCGLDSGNLKFETVQTNKQHICF